MSDIFKKIKVQNGERFAKALRKAVPESMLNEDMPEIVKHAGKDPDDAFKISSYVRSMCLDETAVKKKPECPLALLDRAGYDAYIVTDRKSQDAIKKYFAANEKLCTFGTDRHKRYKIINAVKKNVDEIKRSDFKNPERQDAYGTSVISIQVRDGFVSIKNRYNSTVSNCDATFDNNLDSIIDGLKVAVEDKFGIDLGKASTTPSGFMVSKNKLVKVLQEINGIYYGDTVILENGNIVELPENQYLYAYFVFDMKTKLLSLYDNKIKDSFPEDFNRHYGGRNTLRVDRKGNLREGDTLIIGVSR